MGTMNKMQREVNAMNSGKTCGSLESEPYEMRMDLAALSFEHRMWCPHRHR